MRLLLLLLALFAALTGVAGARAVARPVEAGALAVAPRMAERRIAARPATAFTIRRPRLSRPVASYVLPPAPPLYLDRLRE